MSYKILTTANFNKEAKVLSQKYPSLKNDLAELGKILEENPKIGISLGKGVYKIRLQIKSKNKGKSGGARVLTQVRVIKETVYLFSIFDKSDKENISNKMLKTLIDSIIE